MIGRTNATIGGSPSVVTKTIINVTTESSDLFGKTVTCTDGTESFESTFSDEGKCSFNVNNIATYTIASEGSSVTVEVTELGVTYFVTLIVQAEEQLINYTMLYDSGDECTEVTGGWNEVTTLAGGWQKGNISKGTTQITLSSSASPQVAELGTSKAIDVSEYSKIYYDFNYSEATNGNVTATFVRAGLKSKFVTSATITEHVKYQQYGDNGKHFESIDISDVSGSFHAAIELLAYTYPTTVEIYNIFLVKDDNWQEWISKCGFTHTTLDAVLSDASALEILMNDEEAVKYMIYNCTGTVVSGCIQSQTAIDAIADSKYLSMIYGNVHWKKFLDMIGFAPRTYLYKNGDECEDLTGGWTTTQNVTVSKSDNYMTVTRAGGGNGTCVATNTIDLTNHSKLVMEYNSLTSGKKAILRCATTLSNIDSSDTCVAYLDNSSTSGKSELDISAITGKHYLGFVPNQGTSATSMKVTRVWLE